MRRTRLLTLLVPLLAAAALGCRGSAAPTPTPTGPEGPAGPGDGGAVGAPVRAEAITLAAAGLESSSINPAVDPCTDFFQYACGGWLSANPIPDDRARWGRFSELDARNEQALRALFDEAAAGASTDPASTAIGNYYRACMNEPAIAATGKQRLAPLQKQIAGVRDRGTWMTAVTALAEVGVFAVVGLDSEADFRDSTQTILWLDTPTLGLPDRDYYFEATFTDKVTAYRAHVTRMFGLLGKAKAAAKTAADDVLAIETALAKLTKTGVLRRDLGALYNPTTLDVLAKQATVVEWATLFSALGVDAKTRIAVTTPAFIAGLDGLFAQFKPAQWSNYLAYAATARFAIATSKAQDDEMFARAQALTGVLVQRDRYKRCIDATSEALPDLVSQAYVAKWFPGESKAAATRLIASIAQAMDTEISRLPWMSDATRAKARAKLAVLAPLVGYPDRWKSYEFEIGATDFLGNALRSARHEVRRDLAKAGKPVDRTEWLMAAFEVNAYYNPLANNTALPAGILQTPFFGKDRSIAANLGGVGMVIGHELTHGFDDQGAQFDANGNMANWWQPSDLAAFQTGGQCLVKQYNGFEAAPGQYVNGELTLGENIADLGGVKMAFYAYRALRKDADVTYLADGFSEDQQYFLAVAQAWCSHDRPAEITRRLTTDVHAPPHHRVNGALRNLPEFARAFSCPAATPMAPVDRCTVW